MLNQMADELVRFFSTFGLIIILFLFIGRFLNNEVTLKLNNYWDMFLNIFNAFNGKPNFEVFRVPFGQIYIGVFLFIFKILLMSLLAAMFINKYRTVFKNLDAHKRYAIIRQKNNISYDSFIGGITLTFFPINFIVIPFIAPVILFRSKRISDFLLKV